jgi:hypothetical protein
MWLVRVQGVATQKPYRHDRSAFCPHVRARQFNGEWSDTGKGKNGEDVTIKGYWSTIYRREGEDWKVCLSIFNWHITPPPAAAPSPTASPSGQ